MSDLPLHILAPQTHLNRAGGYFELEMFEEADRELRALPDDDPWLKKKKFFRSRSDRKSKTGQICVRSLVNFVIFIPMKRIGGYQTHLLRGEANQLKKPAKSFLMGLPFIMIVQLFVITLACYACVLGHPGECLDFLKEAVRRDEKYKKMAMEDEDLAAVKEALVSLGWGAKIV